MVSSQAENAYQQTVMQTKIHPVELIHMLYERVLVHLELAEAAILKDQPLNRGEHLSKAIAIVTELYVSVKPDESEASQFLLGLYEAILAELPKVGTSKDVEVLRRSHRYLKQLKEVWEDVAMQEQGFVPQSKAGSTSHAVDSHEKPESAIIKEGNVGSPARQGAVAGRVSFSV